MPRRAARPCSQPGCPNLVKGNGSYCNKHELQRQREYEARRPTAAERGYDGRWRKIRNAYIARRPYCECTDPECFHKDRRMLADEVDHIVPRREGGTDEWTNLQALCKRCHSRKTALTDGRWGVGL